MYRLLVHLGTQLADMPVDILLDNNEDIRANGDFVAGESSLQHQLLLLYSEKGEWKESPQRGVGTRRYLEASDQQGLVREIGQEFNIDGMRINKLAVNFPEIDIEAMYVR